MNLGKSVIERLNRSLDTQDRQKAEHFGFEEEFGGIRFQFELTDFDKYSYFIKNLTLTNADGSKKPVQDFEGLKKKAQELTTTLSYLLEGLSVVEADSENQKIQMRSSAPDQKENALCYYEIMLNKSGAITFRRFQFKKKTQRRTEVPSHLTTEIFERLLNDLSNVIQ
ncbi:hypothetical protein GWO43_23515 [candidate division KSB1 bacterium]|nr:hypothetical protein [candidate division KSB1 bacterium]NIR73177.1 hypothetical protein [candidate division KSB1 bacterium]NIS26947.1 hypothetical protein [candidate division KSB1 bacterium]NIT73785.1 hypothetical protein [candidate division KSB1 bacterium]NIU27691.1 hypothetical protein [candidate division KSB1 bacterium]